MDESELGITEECRHTCHALLESEQSLPHDTLFRDDIFHKTCRKVEDRNEARVIRDITPLIVPSAETLCTYGSTHLDILIESINEGWDNSIPLTKPRPQPDYSVGFKREAFTKAQLFEVVAVYWRFPLRGPVLLHVDVLYVLSLLNMRG